MKRVCIVGASGKLGQYMLQHALDRGYALVGVCRERSVAKLEAFRGRITVIPGATNDPDVQIYGAWRYRLTSDCEVKLARPTASARR